MEAVESRSLQPGTLVGAAYRVVRPIGEGGMGVIYEVEQIATGSRRALKVMHGQFSGNERLRARFVSEARLAASVPSDHVAQVVDAGQDESTGALFIVMELLEGTTLSTEVKQNGPFSWAVGLAILGQITHALAAAHALGIVHRDLKPGNVFLAQSRHAALPFMIKLLDFGIAKAVVGASEATAVVLGTPAWMAPEQTAVGAHTGPAADVWSLGLLAFYVLTGNYYFASAADKAASTAAVLREVIIDDLVPASTRAAQVGRQDSLPPEFDAWFKRCVDRSPDNRFDDARTAYDALARLPPPAAPSSAHARAWLRTGPHHPVADPTVTVVETPRPARTTDASSATQEVASLSSPPAMPARPYRSALMATTLACSIAAIILWVTRTGERSTATTVAPPVVAAVPMSFRMHGSNTIGSALAPALAQAFLARRTGAKTVVVRRTAPDEARVEAREGDRVVDSIEVFAHGTMTGFEDLAAGRCDVGMASSRIRTDGVDVPAALRELASAASEHVIGLDGMAIIVNPANPVSALTKAQVADAFAGRIVEWSAVGGVASGVHLYARDDKSGTYDSFKHLVLGSRPLSPEATRFESSEDLSDAVAADPQAIGFIGLPYVRSAKAIMVQEPGSQPLLPSPVTVSTEEYPIARRLYLYLPRNAPPAAREFVDFALSDDGQQVVQAAGFVDLRPHCDPSASRCASCTKEYREAVRGACRLSMDFRFEGTGLQLDTRALSDLKRLVPLLTLPEQSGKSALLFGFSDATGDRSGDLALSQQRAAVVGQQLSARGLHVESVRGLGSEEAVADDASEDGRERNRRVEAWLR
jgi:phosphate transport system substrate-binding protein